MQCLTSALIRRPIAFIFIHHKGYLFDDAIYREVCSNIVGSLKVFHSRDRDEINPFHPLLYKVICEIFLSGMCTDFEVFAGFPIDEIPSETGYEKFLQMLTQRNYKKAFLK